MLPRASVGNGQWLGKGWFSSWRRTWLKWRGRLLGLVLVVLVGGSMVALALWINTTPWLRIAEVKVAGQQKVEGKRVVEAAGILGSHVLTVDLDAARRRVEGLPGVKRAAVDRSWPTGVTIQVEERRPWGVWRAGNTNYVVDEEGVVLEVASTPSPGPTIIDKDGSLLAPGAWVDGEVLRLAQLLATVVPGEMGGRVLSFEYLKAGGLLVVTDKGQARFGDSKDLEFKLAVWKAVLRAAKDKGIQAGHVDLRFGYRPFLRWS
ncbi:MAG: FtsQ-type POTRA domain-containing protein [Chloroflexi bacterium]|nr:FtsQ-type POTRA domain-containing protein [Chloroflexota bacterium]